MRESSNCFRVFERNLAENLRDNFFYILSLVSTISREWLIPSINSSEEAFFLHFAQTVRYDVRAMQDVRWERNIFT